MGAMVRRSAGRRMVALISGLLVVGSCLAITTLALASPGESCHGVAYVKNRCDASTGSSGPSVLAIHPDPLQVADLQDVGAVARRAAPSAPDQSVSGPFTPRAPPLA